MVPLIEVVQYFDAFSLVDTCSSWWRNASFGFAHRETRERRVETMAINIVRFQNHTLRSQTKAAPLFPLVRS
jgi:hypothetical protein